MSIVTCHTEDCVRNGLPTPMELIGMDSSNPVVCGGCNQPTIDIDPPLPDPEPAAGDPEPDLMSLQERCDSLQEQVDLLILTTLG